MVSILITFFSIKHSEAFWFRVFLFWCFCFGVFVLVFIRACAQLEEYVRCGTSDGDVRERSFK